MHARVMQEQSLNIQNTSRTESSSITKVLTLLSWSTGITFAVFLPLEFL
jgi:hypothetical protein